MRVSDYPKFVSSTDQYSEKLRDARLEIALYGLVGELGSLVSAVKKKLLSEGGSSNWDQPTGEISEELGDTLWYLYSFSSIANDGDVDILAMDIANLQKEIGSGDARAMQIREALDPTCKSAFLQSAREFPPSPDYTFDDYQTLAFKTARTEGPVLLGVCLSVLWQLGAELLRIKLPSIEMALNRTLVDRPTNTVLGEIAWHLAAIASVYHLSLDNIVDLNVEKVSFRAKRGAPTPLHDDCRASGERFPRHFDISFVRIGPGKSRMYFQGRRLGDDLTDNSYDDDGYRFHDVLHLGLIAHLGWSPVVRGLMKIKRPDIDIVEDGGRAKVVEELVLKAIHSEGERQAREAGRCSVEGQERMFPTRGEITFQLLKTLRSYVEGLEVWKNAYWEWEDAILAGSKVFHELRTSKQGTVSVDLESRSLTFRAEVAPRVLGVTVGLGMGTSALEAASDVIAKFLSEKEVDWARKRNLLAHAVAAKVAVLEALAISNDSAITPESLSVLVLDNQEISVSASGFAQERIWQRQVVDFKAAFTTLPNTLLCTVTAIADAGDLGR